jgi:tRNA modification GTPase
MSSSDTIVALASGAGRAGIAVIRVSGSQVRFITETIAGILPPPRQVRRATLVDPRSGIALDQVLVLFFERPASFTGEDIVEFHCHGSRAVVSSVIDCVLKFGEGVRLAEAGEFARRAFLNGKIDLSVVEGLGDLIDSETEWQRRQALRQMDGELSKRVAEWRGRLLEGMALIEATLDFSDEGDVDVDIGASVIPLASALLEEMREVLRGANFGERLREGFRVVIAGAPNAGKSSLLNAIAKREVAIVSPLPGTTRDVIEVRCDIGGYPVLFSDTAGLRQTTDPIERLGIDKARQEIAGADLVLLLKATDSQDIGPEIETTHFVVATKADLGAVMFPHDFKIATPTGLGLDALLQAITRHVAALGGGETALIANARQRHALVRAIEPLARVTRQGESGATSASGAEFAAEDFRQAARALDQLVGRIDVEMVLDTLFSRFCIGK